MKEARVDALKSMLELNPNDGFALYGLALEYKADGLLEEELPLLERAATLEDPLLYTFYQLGEVLLGLGEDSEAAEALRTGLDRARTAGDMKALNEFEALLAMVE